MACPQFLARVLFALSMWLITLSSLACSLVEVDEKAANPLPAQVLEGVRTFITNTALPDGSFRPGIDPAYKGYSDTGIDAAGEYAANLEHFLRGLALPMTLSIGEPKRSTRQITPAPPLCCKTHRKIRTADRRSETACSVAGLPPSRSIR
jgi:hypothetical protein